MLNIINHHGNENQNHSEYYLTPIIKRTQLTNVGEDAEKREHSYTVGGNVNWCSHCGKWYGGFPKH